MPKPHIWLRNPFRHRPGNPAYDDIDSYAKAIAGMPPLEKMHHDASIWWSTLDSPHTAQDNELFVNLFKVLYHGPVFFRTTPTAPWQQWPHPIASLLSHGGRVVIQVPKADPIGPSPDHGFFRWLTGRANIARREGTHTLSPSARQGIQGPYFKFLVEDKGWTYGAGQYVKLLAKGGLLDKGSYGINVPVGGEGNVSAARKRAITADGSFGHLYLYYLPPTHDRCGGVMVGLEGEAPGVWGETGNLHTYNIGWIDRLRQSKPNKKDLPTVFGEKWENLGVGHPGQYDCLWVDLTGTGWRFLQRADWLNNRVELPPAFNRQPQGEARQINMQDPAIAEYNNLPPDWVQPRLDKLAEVLRKLPVVGAHDARHVVSQTIRDIIADRDA